MREILFRGKRIDNNEWVEGGFYLEPYTDNSYIIAWNSMGMGFIEYILVCSDSVGQYTGLEDKNSKRIFEGDILAYRWEDSPHETIEGVVKYGNFNCSCCDGVYGWYCEGGDIRRLDDPTRWHDEERLYVVGNIHDNPELIAEVQDG